MPFIRTNVAVSGSTGCSNNEQCFNSITEPVFTLFCGGIKHVCPFQSLKYYLTQPFQNFFVLTALCRKHIWQCNSLQNNKLNCLKLTQWSLECGKGGSLQMKCWKGLYYWIGRITSIRKRHNQQLQRQKIASLKFQKTAKTTLKMTLQKKKKKKL